MKRINLILVGSAALLLGIVLSFAQNGAKATPTLALSGFQVGEVPPSLRDGDIVFHDSGSDQSLAIKILTHSPYSHVGIYLGGFVYEAHKGINKTPIAEWSKRPRWATHKNETPWKALRLKDHHEGLSAAETEKLKAFFTPEVMGREYDSKFEWSPDKLYCSELVWKAYKSQLGIEVGALQTFSAFDFSDPRAKQLAQDRYGGVDKLPTNETIVTPQAIYESDLLELVPPLTQR